MSAPHPDALAQLAAWHSARPSFALLGEFSAGKSTLLNFLLGDTLLPTQVTATELPPIWITHGPSSDIAVLKRDGSLRPAGRALLTAGGAGDALLVRVTHPAPILRRADMIDTPGISDPRLARDALEFLMPFMDFAIWCSPAGQAWRQTEKMMWASCPDQMRARSILALTRVDKLRSEKDRRRVVKRVRRETEGLFATVLTLDTPAAIAAGEDEAAGIASGGVAFHEALATALDQATQACATRPILPDPSATTAIAKADVDMAVPPTPDLAADPPTPADDTSMSDEAIIQSTVARMAADLAQKHEPAVPVRDALLSRIDEIEIDWNLPTSDTNILEIRRVVNGLSAHTEMSSEHCAVLGRILATTGSDAADPADAIRQFAAELADFAQGPWRRLDVDEDGSANAR